MQVVGSRVYLLGIVEGHLRKSKGPFDRGIGVPEYVHVYKSTHQGAGSLGVRCSGIGSRGSLWLRVSVCEVWRCWGVRIRDCRLELRALCPRWRVPGCP